MLFLETRSEVKFEPIMVCGTSLSQDVSTHLIWNSYLK